MADVEPLDDRDRILDPEPRPAAREAAGGPGRRHRPGFRIERHGERVEGLATGVDPRLLTGLKAGDVAPQAEIDLHRRTREEAEGLLEGLLIRSRTQGLRCLLVIHGRGLSSPGGPVLKEWLIDHLTRRPWSTRVLAFTSSRPGWGGSGAMLVLLRTR